MLQGYRLHDQRLAYSGGTGSMRTIKYELVDTTSGAGVRDCVAEAIARDYLGMYGRLTVADHLQLEPNYVYSMLGFWLLCQRLGVFFGANEASIEGVFAAYKHRRIGWYAVFDRMSEHLRELLDEDAWTAFMSTEQRSLDRMSTEQRANKIRKLAARESDKVALHTYLEPVAMRYATGVLDATDKIAFKCDVFNCVAAPPHQGVTPRTWTIDPDVDVLAPELSATRVVEQTMDRYRQCGLDEKKIVATMGVGSNGNYLNNIFGASGLGAQHAKLEELADEICAAQNYDTSQKKIVIERLGILADYLSRLGVPTLTTRWSEYRGDFNGTLESWFSNRSGKLDEMSEQLTEMLDACIALESIPGLSDAVLSIKQELQSAIQKIPDGRTVSHDESFVLRIIQGELRTALNEWRQTDVGQRTVTAKVIEIDKIFKKNLQSSPQFFGVTQAERFAKLRNAKRDSIDQLDLLEGLWDKVILCIDAEVNITDRTVDALARTYLRCDVPDVKEVYERIQACLGCKFSSRDEKNRFYISGFERREGIVKINYTTITLGSLARIVTEANLFDSVRRGLIGNNVLRDTVELLKTIFAALLGALHNDTTFDVHDMRQLFTDRQKMLIDDGDTTRVDPVSLRLLSTFAFSELSGFAATLSREFFVVRATVQATNGRQAVLGYTENRKKTNDSYRRYFVYMKDLVCDESGAVEGQDNLVLARKSYNYELIDFKPTSCRVDKLLSIRSSRYQIQFIEWLLGYNKKRRGVLRAGGAFMVLERGARLDWSGDQPKLSFDDTPRVFLSQPFTIVPPDRGLRVSEPLRYMGVDIGEYGLAWVVIEVVDDHATVVAGGFLVEGQHRALAGRVRQLRERQTRATFTMPSMRVARLRGSLTGSYRAKLEALSMKYDARLSFEYEVSAFETGGARIAKIYSSIKRSDVLKKDNNIQNKQAWGKASKDDHFWAYETAAAGTSQTCSSCKRWASRYISDSVSYLLEPHRISGLSSVKLDNGESAVCFAPNKKELSGRELKKAIYKAMRPNQDGVAMGLLQAQTRAKIDASWRKNRGNIALFICPFASCHHASDADLQAALNIALRGHIKHQYKDSKDVKLSAEFFYEITCNMNYEPIEL